MAYNNFIPSLWAEGIERDLDRLCVFVEDCNRKYEGKVSEKGDSVRIFGVGKPTIFDIDRKNAAGDIGAPEEIQDTSITMQIKKVKVFNFKVGDIDKAQAIKGLMEELRQETSEELSSVIDEYIASLALDKQVKALHTAPLRLTADKAVEGEVNVLHVLENAAQKLYENDVKQNTKIVVTVSPRFFTLFRRAYTGKDTDNSEMMANGQVGKYAGIIIKQSNNVATSANGSVDNIMLRTQRAIAFANPLTHVEAYRPDFMFADAIKGFELFDACVARPKEVININVTY